MSRVIVGVDPHKKSVTIEAVDEHGQVLAWGRFATDSSGSRRMLKYVRDQWPHRRWAMEGAGQVRLAGFVYRVPVVVAGYGWILSNFLCKGPVLVVV